MKRHWLMGGVLVVAACATTTATGPDYASAQGDAASVAAVAYLCGADAGAGKAWTPDLRMIDGMGTGGFKVDSGVKAAQDWFDYGLALSHAFYHNDAKAAMRRAVEADPSCSLCAWGEAWVLGPTLNYGINDEERQAALAAAERALSLAKPGDVKARRLAETIIARYQKADQSTEPAFGAAMAQIAREHPQDIDLAVLASHSLLIPVRARNRSGLKPALDILEGVLRQRPDDTGAIHYYIHGTEFDGRAEDALPYAKRLGDLAPAASHLVHMPAHTFFRAGHYHDAAVVNAEAIGSDMRWYERGGDDRGSAGGYYSHNLSFGLAGALMSGDAPLAIQYAAHARQLADHNASINSGVLPRTWVALGLFAPDLALALPEPAASASVRQGIYHPYARGEALIRKGDIAGARAELARLAPPTGDATESPERIIARGVLEGRIAMAEGDPTRAAALFEAAAEVQETRLAESWDPPSWWYPVRRSVAAAWLEAGQPRRAEAEARASLASWKHDPLALWVLGQAQSRQGKAAAARRSLAEAERGWRGRLDTLFAAVI